MQKNKRKSAALRISVMCALLAAMSIVLGKFLAINLGEVLRLSFENLPIIFAGAAFGPLAGVLVGTLADLLGCLMVGYAINPLVTLGAAAVGAMAGIYSLFSKMTGGVSRFLRVALTVLFAHLVGSVLIKTAGLSAFYAMPYYALLLWRALNYLIVGSLEFAILSVLLCNGQIRALIDRMKGGAGA